MSKTAIFIISVCTICVICTTSTIIMFERYKTLQTALKNPQTSQKPSITITTTLKHPIQGKETPQNQPITVTPRTSYGRPYLTVVSPANGDKTYTQEQMDQVCDMYEQVIGGLRGNYDENTTVYQYAGGMDSTPIIPTPKHDTTLPAKCRQIQLGAFDGSLMFGAGDYFTDSFGINGYITSKGQLGVTGAYRW